MNFLLIVDKPAGIPVHPSILHYEDSLSNGVKYYFEKIGLKTEQQSYCLIFSILCNEKLQFHQYHLFHAQ